jgi:pimeloyl-ACP methyl ester carboxylesterase
MVDFETGFFLEKIPYVKFGDGPKTIVAFQGSMALILKIGISLKGTVKEYGGFLPPGYTCYVLGYDRNLPEGTSVEQIASDFSKIVKEIGKSIIVGRSYGGLVAITFAASYPDLTERLILLSSAWKLSETGFEFGKNLLTALLNEDFAAASRELGSLFTARFYRALIPLATRLLRRLKRKEMYPNTTLVNAYKDMVNTAIEREQYLSKINVPTYIIGGAKDRVFSRENYEETAARIANAKLILFENAGHMLETVDKDELRGKIMSCFT